MMKAIIFTLALIITTGCATQQNKPSQANIYSNNNRLLVESGEMKWSDYYKGLYDAIAAEPSIETGDVLIVINDLIKIAGNYESNQITKEAFESERRIAKAKLAKIESDYIIKMQQIQASRPAPEPYVYQPYIRNTRQAPPNAQMPRTTNCSTWANQTNCTTY